MPTNVRKAGLTQATDACLGPCRPLFWMELIERVIFGYVLEPVKLQALSRNTPPCSL